MFENFKKIKIKGGYFDEETELEFFKGDVPLSVVYGRNGSGKSTIARCLKQLSETALKQIQDKQYDTELRTAGVEVIYKYGVAFCGKRVEIAVG